jgi:hypothetical protein
VLRVPPALLLAAVIGVVVGANLNRQNPEPAAAAAVGGYTVTDGWAHSPFTRQGATVVSTGGAAVTDGWAHSPITRFGASYDPIQNVGVTDGWAHSPITRFGTNDLRIAELKALAARYDAQGPAAEARSR